MAVTHTIIDIHCHTAGIGAGGSGCFVSPALRRSWKYHLYLRAFGVTEQEVREQGDGVILERLAQGVAGSGRVAKAVILAMDGICDSRGELDLQKTEIHIPNSFLAASCARHDNLLFGASINPFRRNALERLDEAVAGGAVLMKWLPSIMHIDPADPALVPFYTRLREHNLPLLTHTGNEHSFTTARNQFADPERLRLPLSLGVTVIGAHAATNGRNSGEANFDRFLRLCREFPNLYADISALTQLNRVAHLPRVLRSPELHGRLLYGTDMPLINTPVVLPFVFAPIIGLRRTLAIVRMKNAWDQDVALKEALGVSAEVFSAGNMLLQTVSNCPGGTK